MWANLNYNFFFSFLSLFSLSCRLLFVFSDDGDQLFEGLDCEAKEKIARELAKLVFGSQESFVSICLSSFSLKYLWNKRSRDEEINWFPFVEDLSQSWSILGRVEPSTLSLSPQRSSSSSSVTTEEIVSFLSRLQG